MTFYGMLALIVLPKFVKCNKTAPLLMHLLNSGGQRHTHFIFRVGNTITLEDVAILLGVRIHSVPVIGSTNPNTIALQDMCEELLGGLLGSYDVEGSKIKLKWLTQHFGWLYANSDVTIAQHARGYILSLLGYVLMPNKSNSVVHEKFLQLLENVNEIGLYSWCSACLTFLYRGLDCAICNDTKEICGCLILLQVWVWQWLP